MIKSRLLLILQMRIILKLLSLNSSTITIIKLMASQLLIKKTQIQGWMSKLLTLHRLIMGRTFIIIHLECKEGTKCINNKALQILWIFYLTTTFRKMGIIPLHRCTQITITHILLSHICSPSNSNSHSLRKALVFLIILF